MGDRSGGKWKNINFLFCLKEKCNMLFPCCKNLKSFFFFDHGLLSGKLRIFNNKNVNLHKKKTSEKFDILFLKKVSSCKLIPIVKTEILNKVLKLFILIAKIEKKHHPYRKKYNNKMCFSSRYTYVFKFL